MDRPLDGLGASDAAAILGVSRWHSPLDVWNQKMGIAKPEKKEEHQEWGLLLEPALAARYSQITGRRLRRVGTIRSKVHPLLYAHPDRLVVGESGLVEIKVSRSAWDEIPIYYKTQAIQQMICADREWVDFAVLVHGQRFLTPIPRLERDRSIEPDFIAELEDWWQRHIIGGEPPDMDGGEAGKQYLRKTYPEGDGEIVATAQMLPMIDQFRIAQHNRKQVEQEEERLKQKIQVLIGEGSSLVGPFGKISLARFNMTKTAWESVARAYRRIIEDAQDDRSVLFDADLDAIESLHTGTFPARRLTPSWKEEQNGE